MTDHYDGFSGSSEEDIHALRGGQKSDITARVASREGYNDNVAFFALIIVWHEEVSLDR